MYVIIDQTLNFQLWVESFFNYFIIIFNELIKSSNYSRLQAVNRNNDLKILVVDDYETFRGVTKDMIAKWGYQVCTASDGNEAISVYKKEKPDAVLMDLKMPELDGFSAFEKIKKLDSNVKMFLMTAYQDDPRLYDAKSKGIVHIFEKPFSLRDLKDMLKSHLGRGKPQKI